MISKGGKVMRLYCIAIIMLLFPIFSLAKEHSEFNNIKLIEDNGNIIKSTDGGKTWVENNLFKITYFKANGEILKSTDGGKTWHKISNLEKTNTIKRNKEVNLLNVYPNPTSKSLNIISKNEIKTISIFNMNSNKVLERNSLNRKQIRLNLNDLNQGLYQIRILINEKYYTKFIFLNL